MLLDLRCGRFPVPSRHSLTLQITMMGMATSATIWRRNWAQLQRTTKHRALLLQVLDDVHQQFEPVLTCHENAATAGKLRCEWGECQDRSNRGIPQVCHAPYPSNFRATPQVSNCRLVTEEIALFLALHHSHRMVYALGTGARGTSEFGSTQLQRTGHR